VVPCFGGLACSRGVEAVWSLLVETAWSQHGSVHSPFPAFLFPMPRICLWHSARLPSTETCRGNELSCRAGVVGRGTYELAHVVLEGKNADGAMGVETGR
jgi:hypothetical protein